MPGLWSLAAEQAQAAAVNALGGDLVVKAQTPVTNLKGIGLKVFSVGKIDPDPPDQVIVLDTPQAPSYRRLVLSEGHAVGAVVVGDYPADIAAAHRAVRERISVGAAARAALQAGDWNALEAVEGSSRARGLEAGFA